MDLETYLQSEYENDHLDTVQRATECGAGMAWLAKADGDAVDGWYPFVASEGAIDRHGDIVEQTWRLKNWRANPVILWEHGFDSAQGMAVIGRGKARVEKGEIGERLMLSVHFHASETNPLGMLAEEQHRLKFRSAVSVGFIPGQAISRTKLPSDHPAYMDGVPEWQAGRLYRFNELLEVSSVAVPALASALQIRSYASETEDPEEQVRRVLREMTGPKVRALLAEVASVSEEFRRAVRSYVLGAPAPHPPQSKSLAALLKEA